MKRLLRGREARSKFVASQISNGIAFQIRALRNRNHLTQPKLAELVGTTQNQIYRLEKASTAKPTITTLKKVAAAFDVALVVRFEPFSQLVDWVSATPFVDPGLNSLTLGIPDFQGELNSGMFGEQEESIAARTDEVIDADIVEPLPTGPKLKSEPPSLTPTSTTQGQGNAPTLFMVMPTTAQGQGATTGALA